MGRGKVIRMSYPCSFKATFFFFFWALQQVFELEGKNSASDLYFAHPWTNKWYFSQFFSFHSLRRLPTDWLGWHHTGTCTNLWPPRDNAAARLQSHYVGCPILERYLPHSSFQSSLTKASRNKSFKQKLELVSMLGEFERNSNQILSLLLMNSLFISFW